MAEDNEKDKDHPDNKKLTGESWGSLREKKRSCTDCLFLVKLYVHKNK
jgi:hypothetical protein